MLTLVFHDQAERIDDEVAALKRKLTEAGLPSDRAIHVGPIVRKEDEYASLSLSTGRSVFGSFYAFTRKPEWLTSPSSSKKRVHWQDPHKEPSCQGAGNVFRDHMDYFLSFDKVIVYYENGQSPVTVLIGTVCGSDFFDVDYRNVIPSDYRLFQSADLLCTLELAGIKADAGKLSRSEGYSSKSGESSRRTTWTSLKS